MFSVIIKPLWCTFRHFRCR